MTAAQTGPLRRLRTPEREDASAVVGLQDGRVQIAAAVVLAGFVLLGLTGEGVDSPWLYTAAFGLLVVAWALPLRAPGTPMDGRAAAAVLVSQSVAVIGVVAAVEPVVRGPLMPCAGATAIVGALLCLRGRVGTAWIAFVVLTAILVIAGVVRAQPLDYVQIIVPGNLGIVVLLSVFASVVAPRADQIFALRRQARRAAAEVAARTVRDQQLARLDNRVRPLLQRIADGQVLTERELNQCRLVEAQLRDRIRAPGLDLPHLFDCAWAARSRGVRVVLLDDGPTTSVAVDDRRARILAEASSAAVTVLRDAASGALVTVRLLPAGRDAVATISVAVDGSVSLQEFS
ncbi:hypothetical protein [Gordonia humi]|uniref:Signal transduction histidine kinase n=1 Tax=Gordonia humi TaxID=686429 RepID=A0A840EUD4_9ACTN|nr:hypothetical protein [Gordonia humi]MBB4135302.1 hypothetical protein [Gordonia humi]